MSILNLLDVLNKIGQIQNFNFTVSWSIELRLCMKGIKLGEYQNIYHTKVSGGNFNDALFCLVDFFLRDLL